MDRGDRATTGNLRFPLLRDHGNCSCNCSDRVSGVFSTNLLSVLIHFLLADCLGDILLTALPIIFLLDMKLSRERMISIFATFSASMVINVLTVTQATVPLKPDTSGSVVIAHTKASVRSGAHKPRVSYEMHAASNSLLDPFDTADRALVDHITCHLLVLVTVLYRTVHSHAGLEALGAEGKRTDSLTRVDHDQETCPYSRPLGRSSSQRISSVVITFPI